MREVRRAAPAPRAWRRSRRGLAGALGIGGAGGLGALLAACGAPGAPTSEPSKQPVQLELLHHNGAVGIDEIRADAEEYRKAVAPHVSLVATVVEFNELRQKTLALAAADTRPSLYSTYALWLREFQKLKLLAGAPADATGAIKKLYSAGLVDGITIDGKVLGFPREVNTYLLIYSKQAFSSANVARPPETWETWKAAAQAATERTEDGRKGLTVVTGQESAVVHPLTALMWSNGGEYAAADGSRVLFDQPRVVEALQFQVDLIRNGAALTGGSSTFAQGRTAMIVFANWWHAALKRAKGEFFEDVAVAPLPRGAGKQTTIMYVWLYGVDAAHKGQQEAWRFLTWLNSPKAPGESSREGDRLARAGTLPPATADFTFHRKGLLDAPFLQPYIDSLAYARSEDSIFNGDLVKRALQQEVEAAYTGQKTAQQALSDAAREGNRLIAEGRGA
jgi:multiple sugar transport system substrate-binding protein